jgi:hypothetical protein
VIIVFIWLHQQEKEDDDDDDNDDDCDDDEDYDDDDDDDDDDDEDNERRENSGEENGVDSDELWCMACTCEETCSSCPWSYVSYSLSSFLIISSI